ncbi:peptidoglycan DD-metalloendopeptidase family protein [Bacteroidia bacterium]|jgi:septal ring factor EnvC (AmiA/AmiB activator)|nr:peptidoglycan DD-metalloendopeptidase family protein [Bacteroidia bacterium]
MKKVIILFLAFIVTAAWATDRKKLERQRNAKLAEIRETNRILRQTRSKKNVTLKELRSINNLIKVREEILDGLANELTGVQKDEFLKQQQLKGIKIHLINQKDKYAKSVANTYRLKNSTGNNWHFIFSSTSFNQLFQRFRYLQKITQYQKQIVLDIENDKREVEEGIVVLTGLKQEKELIIGDKETEKQKLEQDKQIQQKTVNVLAGKEKDLRRKLKAQKAAKAKLDREIERLIRIELEKARKRKAYDKYINLGDKSFNKGDYESAVTYYEKALNQWVNTKTARDKLNRAKAALKKQKATGAKPAVPKEKVIETPSVDKVNTANFLANKGKLPWPTSNGFISEKYGTHAHPTISGVSVNNNGVNILSTSGTVARVVFPGTVVAVMEIPGMQNMVMVSHGDYFTVYAKLSNVFVKTGDKVTLKQSLGKIYTGENNATELHFELWHNQTKQNPAYWIIRK